MKFKFEVECTPDEARQCLGLPNVAPLQERMLNQIEATMQENVGRLDLQTLMTTWLPAPIPGWGEMQNIFLNQMGVKPSAKK
jgi:hypothetical protein